MKIFILILLLNSTIRTYSQISKGIIGYSVQLTEDQEFLKNESIGPLYKTAIKDAQNLKFTLYFSGQETYFTVSDQLNSDGGNSDLSKAFSGYTSEVYTNIKENKSLKKSSETIFPKGKYVIEESIQEDWVLKSETKFIDGYECFKAETIQVVKNSKGIFKHPVTAWYCPKIPIRSGPNGYGNLPGLILELQVRNTVFGATTINLAPDKEPKIEKPFAGKKISMESYNKEIEKITTERFTN